LDAHADGPVSFAIAHDALDDFEDEHSVFVQ
jgi:hypothetical protein